MISEVGVANCGKALHRDATQAQPASPVVGRSLSLFSTRPRRDASRTLRFEVALPANHLTWPASGPAVSPKMSRGTWHGGWFDSYLKVTCTLLG